MFWEFSGDRYGVLLNTVYETINSTTSTFENKNNWGEITIYPNPVTTTATIEFPNPENKAYNLTLTNISCKTMQTINHITGNKILIEKGNLSSGIYYIELRGDKVFRDKIIIE